MKSIKLALALAAFALVGSASAVTSVSYTYQTINNSTDTTWVTPSGSTSVVAFNMGGYDASFGGVTWQSTNPHDSAQNTANTIDMLYYAPGSWASNTSGFYNSTTASVILSQGNYSDYAFGGNDYRVELNNLTVGLQYQVQFVVADNREGTLGRQISINNYSANIDASPDSAFYQYGYEDDRYVVITAQFTPSLGDTNFSFRPAIGAAGLQVNAIHVLTVIPEPGAALLGGIGMLALLRRRR